MTIQKAATAAVEHLHPGCARRRHGLAARLRRRAMTGDGGSTDPRIEVFRQFLAVFDAWKANPDGPDTHSAAGIAILRDEMLIETIGMIADDPIVAQFRSLIPLSEEFLEKRGQPRTHAAAVELIEQSLATLHEIGVHQAVQHVFYAAVRNVVDGMDMPTDDMIVDSYAEGAAGFLRGEAALHDFVTSLLLPPSLGQLFQRRRPAPVEGRREPDRTQGPGAKAAEQDREACVDNFRARSVLRAHYEGGSRHPQLGGCARAAVPRRSRGRDAAQEMEQGGPTPNGANSPATPAGRRDLQQHLNDRETGDGEGSLRYDVDAMARELRDLASGLARRK